MKVSSARFIGLTRLAFLGRASISKRARYYNTRARIVFVVPEMPILDPQIKTAVCPFGAHFFSLSAASIVVPK